MSGTGSPADRTDTVNTNAEGGAPAGVKPDAGVSQDGSGDANSHAASTSDVGDKPGATKDAPKPTLADVIKTAADAKPEGEGKSPDPAKDGKEAEGAAAPDAAKAEGDQDDSKLPFHNHPRWKEVVGQNKTLKDEVATLTPDAEQFRNINTFMQEHSLTPDEVGEGFIIMAMAKNGDARVLQKLDDFRNKIALAIGEAVPTDIQAKIDSGEITEDAGKELAKNRAKLAMSEKQNADRTAQDERTRQTNNARDLANRQAAAVAGWEVEAKKTDPDFAKKEKAVARYARALMQERGNPKTEAEAVQLIKDAYSEVNKDFTAALPAKQPVTHVPSVPSHNGAKEKPKSMMDAIRFAASQ